LSFTSLEATWPVLIFALVTELLLSWAVPTLFFGSVAAQATPLIAMNTAMLDITFA
jgi:hypothetical protein